MMNDLGHPPSPCLDDLLARAARRARRVSLWAAAARVVAGAAGLLFAAMLLDAACALPAWALRLEQAIFAAAAVFGAVLLWRAWNVPVPSPAAMARALEDKLNLAPSCLANAVDLRAAAPSGASPVLCAEAVRMGEAVAHALPQEASGAAADTRDMRLGVRAMGAALILCAAVFGLFPGLLKAGLPRLWNPSAGFAAYTPLHFEVAVAPNPVIEGDPAAIRAAITGTGVPDEAWLVFLRGAAGAEEDERVPMPREGADQERGRFAAVLDHPSQTRRFYVETARGRSAILTLSVLALPRVEAVSAVLRPPAYTGWPETKQRVGVAGVSLMEGGEAQFRIDCSMPVAGATVRFTPDGGKPVETACQTDPKDDRRLLLSWPVSASGELEVTAKNAAGLSARKPLCMRVTAIPDGPPSIRIDEPDQLLYAPEGDRVTVRVSASDDVAVAKVLTLRLANGWGPFEAPVAFKPSPDAGRVTGEFTFDLAALGAKAGDVIVYSAVAVDGRPEVPGATGAARRGPQRAQSDKQAIRVISREEYLRHLRQEKRVAEIAEEAHRIQEELAALKNQREEALKAAAAAAEVVREKLEKGQPLTEADRAAVDKASEKTAAFAKAAQEAADRALKRAKEPAAYGFEKKYLGDMEKMAQELKDQAFLADAADDAAKEAAAAKDPADPAHRRAREALDRFRDKKEPFGEKSAIQEDAKGLDKLAATDALKSLEDDLKALALDQAELEKDMARFKRRDTLSEEEKLQAAQLGEKQKDLRRQLADITGEMAQVLGQDGDKVPEQAAKARALLDDLMKEGVAQDMDDAGTLASAGDGRMAHAAAASAAEKLLRLLKPAAKDDGEDEEAKDDLEDALGMDEEALGECLGQMGEARGAQEGQSPGNGQGESSGEGKGRGKGRGHGRGRGAGQAGGEGRVGGPPKPKAAVHGAQGDSQGKSGSADGRGKGAGHGQGAGNNNPAADARPAENIEAGADAGRDASGAPMPGVPPAYRGLTERYFKRVLEDSNKNGGQP